MLKLLKMHIAVPHELGFTQAVVCQLLRTYCDYLAAALQEKHTSSVN